MTHLADLSATEALARFRARELSPVELVSAVIERAEAVEPAIAAFSDTRYERATEAAREAEARYAGHGEAPRALEGLPVALKEEQAIAGEPLRLGSLLTGDAPEPAAHPVIERVLAAGAIGHARSTTPEFSCAGFTHSRLWGVTRNPWNLERAAGGSSGGSAAALAAGSATLATGSDIAGSIRIPASMCGVVGFKPPHGRVPEVAPYFLDSYCANGPLARTVADCALLEDVMAGPHPLDPTSQRPRHRLAERLGDVAGLRIALCPVPGDYAVDPDVAANARAAGAALADAGARVEEVELDWGRADVVRGAMVHYGTLWTPYLAALLGEDGDARSQAMPYTLDLLARCEAAVRETGVYGGVLLEARVLEVLGRVHERYDALLCPTLALPALAAGEDYVGGGPTVDGQRLDHYFEMLLTIPFNVAGRCPVLSMPSGLGRRRRPDRRPGGRAHVRRRHGLPRRRRARARRVRLRRAGRPAPGARRGVRDRRRQPMTQTVPPDVEPRQPAPPPTIEQRSIDWVPNEERRGKVSHLGAVWFVNNINLTAMATGVTALSFGGTLFWTIVATVLGALFGTFFMAFHSAQGPQLGLAQLVQSRAQFGYLGAAVTVWVFALVNYIAYNTADAILSGQAMNSLFGIPTELGFVVAAAVAAVLAIYGYHWIHRLDRLLAWPLVALMVLLTVAALTNASLPAGAFTPGEFQLAPFMTAFVIVAGFQLGWAPYVSDYSRYLPSTVGVRATFWWTYLPSGLSGMWVFVLGSVMYAAGAGRRDRDRRVQGRGREPVRRLRVGGDRRPADRAARGDGRQPVRRQPLDDLDRRLLRPGAPDPPGPRRDDRRDGGRRVGDRPVRRRGALLRVLRQRPRVPGLPVHAVDGDQPGRLLPHPPGRLRHPRDLQSGRHLRALGLAREHRLRGHARDHGPVLRDDPVHRADRGAPRRRRLLAVRRSPGRGRAVLGAVPEPRPRHRAADGGRGGDPAAQAQEGARPLGPRLTR